MNGLNRITERIALETQEEIAAIEAESQEKCREIKAVYDKLAQEEYWRIAREGAKDAELQAERFSRAAVLEAKKTVLAMKQEAVSDVFQKAVDAICNLPDAEYALFLAKLAGEAAFTGEEEIIFNARDRAAHARAVLRGADVILRKRGLPARLTLSSTVGNFKGGILVKQGDIVVNCTVETLVEMSREKLSSQVAEILFEES